MLPFFRFGGTIGTRDQCASAYYAYFYCQRTEFILQSTFGREAYYCRSVCVSSNFTEEDYQTLGARIKCNPAIKTAEDRKALQEAVNSGLIDAIATDHAPHSLSEKEGGALKAMSGMPTIQFSLVSMLELADKGAFSIEKVVEKMSHAPAQMYEIRNRGFIRKGYQADLVLVRPDSAWTVTTDCILSKCKWSPLEGHTFHWKVEKSICERSSVI